MKLKYHIPVAVPFIIFLIALALVNREHRHLVHICLLIALLPFGFRGLIKLRNDDKEKGTNYFKHRLVSIAIVVVTLRVSYLWMRLNR